MKTQNKTNENKDGLSCSNCGHFNNWNVQQFDLCDNCQSEIINQRTIITAEDLINETETEPFTIEERTDLNINKMTHDKVKRANK